MQCTQTKLKLFISYLKKKGNLAYPNIEREMFKDCKTASMAKTRTHTHTLIRSLAGKKQQQHQAIKRAAFEVKMYGCDRDNCPEIST